MAERLRIDDVFTPRNKEVNLDMYIYRGVLERDLFRSVTRNIHTVLLGESGNGKSWLYKKVLKENGIPFEIANCANASRLNSLTDEICRGLIEVGASRKIGYQEGGKVEAGAFFAKGELNHTGEFAVNQTEPLLQAFNSFAMRNGSGRKILVLDNLELILHSKNLLHELADIVILLDDPRYAASEVNLLIVGLPSDMFEYFGKTKNLESVTNRLEEINRVGSLSESDVKKLVERGFNDLLLANLHPSIITNLAKHVFFVTLGIAQKVHEYCSEFAELLKGNKWTYHDHMIIEADTMWLTRGLHKCVQILHRNLSNRNLGSSRLNQVIYSIAHANLHSFTAAKVKEDLERNFKTTLPSNSGVDVNKILRKLSKSDPSIITWDQKANQYYIKDPRFIMCARMLLIKDETTQLLISRRILRP